MKELHNDSIPTVGFPRIKLSQDIEKLLIPFRKNLYRIYDAEGKFIMDVMQEIEEEPLLAGQRQLVRNPFKSSERAYVTPAKVESLLPLKFDGNVVLADTTITKAREHCQSQIASIKEEHIVPTNATSYKVWVSDCLYTEMYKLWEKEAPIKDLN